MPRNIAYIYVSMFGKYLQFLGVRANMDDISEMICQIFQYYIQRQYDQDFLHLCYHYWVSNSADKYSQDQDIQYSLIAHPYFNNISIENYKQEILATFMLTLPVFTTISLNLLYLEVIVNIKCYIPTRKTLFFKKRNARKYCQHLCQHTW